MNLNQLIAIRKKHLRPKGYVYLSLCGIGQLDESNNSNPFTEGSVVVEIARERDISNLDYRGLHGLYVCIAFWNRIEDALKLIDLANHHYPACLFTWCPKTNTSALVSTWGEINISRL